MILLETERLRLRRFTADDVDRLVELDSDPEVMRYITYGVPTPRERYEREILPRWFALYESTPLSGYWATGLAAQPGVAAWQPRARRPWSSTVSLAWARRRSRPAPWRATAPRSGSCRSAASRTSGISSIRRTSSPGAPRRSAPP